MTKTNVDKSMIKLLESQKYLAEHLLGLPPIERMDALKEWALGVMLILGTLKGVVAITDENSSSEALRELATNLENTILEIKAGVGYNGPIGQA
jgi:hypothetical protein